jgi:hypothetical protein
MFVAQVRGTHMTPTTYEVHVRGHLPEQLARELGGATSIDAPPETVLLTPPVDQAGLHEILARVRDFGIELVEIRQTSERGYEEAAEPE